MPSSVVDPAKHFKFCYWATGIDFGVLLTKTQLHSPAENGSSSRPKFGGRHPLVAKEEVVSSVHNLDSTKVLHPVVPDPAEC